MGKIRSIKLSWKKADHLLNVDFNRLFTFQYKFHKKKQRHEVLPHSMSNPYYLIESMRASVKVCFNIKMNARPFDTNIGLNKHDLFKSIIRQP